MVDHSTTLVRAYSGVLTYYLVPVEMDHVNHTTTTTIVKTKFTKVDQTTGMQRILPYQYIWQFVQLLPTWLGEPIELTSAYQTLNLL